jgi:hypothetical protein
MESKMKIEETEEKMTVAFQVDILSARIWKRFHNLADSEHVTKLKIKDKYLTKIRTILRDS